MENFVVDLLNITILWMDNIKKKTEFFEKKKKNKDKTLTLHNQ